MYFLNFLHFGIMSVSTQFAVTVIMRFCVSVRLSVCPFPYSLVGFVRTLTPKQKDVEKAKLVRTFLGPGVTGVPIFSKEDQRPMS